MPFPATPWACRLLQTALSFVVMLSATQAHSAVGLGQIAATEQDGPVTVYYPTQATPLAIKKGAFAMTVAENAAPMQGNRLLVVISHGSGSTPWANADLAAHLVKAGYTVAVPQHRGDNAWDDAHPGPDSWKQRPAEVSRAIDAMGRDRRFATLLDLSHVGMFGMSAGGHTALTLAGGRWSSGNLRRHCEAHLAEDFQTCVGLATYLHGSIVDGLRKSIALMLIRRVLTDEGLYDHIDPRIAAVVAGVPVAADYDMSTLAHPRIPVGLITARKDRWLVPQFHSDAVLQVCKTCEHLLDLPQGGHGALMSPLYPHATGLLGKLINDPPTYDRAAGTAAINAKLLDFFDRHLRR